MATNTVAFSRKDIEVNVGEQELKCGGLGSEKRCIRNRRMVWEKTGGGSKNVQTAGR